MKCNIGRIGDGSCGGVDSISDSIITVIQACDLRIFQLMKLRGDLETRLKWAGFFYRSRGGKNDKS